MSPNPDFDARITETAGMAVMFITHNLGVIAEIADGSGDAWAKKSNVNTIEGRKPKHPYTTAFDQSQTRKKPVR
jgi:ABC-type dipeptide/oligopeptide/nickel transport system ATPase component